MQNQKLTIVLIGLITIAISVILFFIFVDQPATVDWLGLLFIVYAEALATAGIVLSSWLTRDSYSPVLYTGATCTLSIYAFLAVLEAILFMSFLRDKVDTLIGIQVILLGITIIALLLIISFSRNADKINEATMRATAFLEVLAGKILLLKHNKQNLEYAMELEKIYEGIQFTDHSALVETDQVIEKNIEELEFMLKQKDTPHSEEEQHTFSESIQNLIGNILQLLEQRTLEVQQLKMGRV